MSIIDLVTTLLCGKEPSLEKKIMAYSDTLYAAWRSSLFASEVNPIFGWGGTALNAMADKVKENPPLDDTEIRQQAEDIYVGTLSTAISCEPNRYNRFPVEIRFSKICELCPGMNQHWAPQTQKQHDENAKFVQLVGEKVRSGEIPKMVWVNKFINDFPSAVKELNAIRHKNISDWFGGMADAIKKQANGPDTDKSKTTYTMKIPHPSELEGLYSDEEDHGVEIKGIKEIQLHTHSGVITTACIEGDQYIPVETIKELDQLLHRVRKICEDNGKPYKKIGIDFPEDNRDAFANRISAVNCGFGCKSSPDPNRSRLEVYVYPIGKLDELDTWLKEAISEAK